MKDSKIEWTTNTFNPWTGCSKVSPGCEKCYAESWAKRTGHPELWAGERRRTTASNWRQPEKWDRMAAIYQHAWAEGIALHGGDEAKCIANGFIKPERPRVFCASLADVFDNQVPDEWRFDLWALIERTPHLDWLLLTKRPQNMAKMLPWSERPWPHVWLGTTAENQEEADRRILLLLATPAAVRFLSCEPLLGPINLGLIEKGNYMFALHADGSSTDFAGIHWVIVGSESGPGARAMSIEWPRSIVDQCAAAGVACFVKQIANANDRKGGNPEHWPPGHWPREFPRVPA